MLLRSRLALLFEDSNRPDLVGISSYCLGIITGTRQGDILPLRLQPRVRFAAISGEEWTKIGMKKMVQATQHTELTTAW